MKKFKAWDTDHTPYNEFVEKAESSKDQERDKEKLECIEFLRS